MSNPSYKLPNRVLAMALAILLVLGMAPIPVWAAGSTVTTNLTTQTVVTGEYTEFTVTTVANDHADTMVLGYFDFNDGDWSVIDSLQYKESTDDQWYDLPKDTPFGPSGTGFPMSDATSTFRVKFNTAGTYSFSISMKTVSDSTELCSMSGSVTVSAPSSDTTPPTVDSVSGNPTDWVQSATISVTASDADSGVEKVVYSTNSTYSDSYSSATLENGTYNFEVTENGKYYVWAVDVSGNVSDAEEITIDKIDTTAPTIGNVTLDPDSWTNGTVQVSIEASDSDSGVDKVVMGTTNDYSAASDADVTFDASTGTYSFTVAENATYYVWAVDGSGNVSEAKGITVSKIDTTAPTIDNVTFTPDDWTSGAVQVSIEASDVGSDVERVVYSADSTYSDNYPSATLENGTYNFKVSENGSYYVWAVDGSGNVSDAKEITVYKIDTSVPTIDNVTLNPDSWTNGTVQVSIEASDDGSGVDKVVMGTTNDYSTASNTDVTFDASTGTYSFTVSGNGDYYVWAVDNAENHSNPTKVEIACIDKEAPTINAEPDTNVWTCGDITISGTASDVGSGVTKVVVGTTDDYSAASEADVTFNASIGTYSFTVAGNGDYYVWAVDKVGNYSSMVTVTIGNIDKVAPTGSITIKQSTWDTLLSALTFGLYSNDQLDVTITAADSDSGVEKIEYYKISGASLIPLTEYDLDTASWVEYTTLSVSSDENFVIYAKVTDYAGNYTYFSSDGAIVDKTNAGITLTPSDPAADNGDADVYGYYNGDVTVGIEVEDTDPYSGIKSIEYWITMDGVEGVTETLYSFGYDGSYDATAQWAITGSDMASENGSYTGIPTQDMLKSEWSGEITINAADYNSSDVVVSVKVTDNAGNVNTETVALDIDTTSPAISISYDDNSPINGTYFRSTRTATIVITERAHHFDAEAATDGITITATDANGNPVAIDTSTMISDWAEQLGASADETTYTATITYSADANYTFSIAYSDKAGNAATIDTGDSAVSYAFTVDTTVPTGYSVSILNNPWSVLLEKLTFGLFTNDEFDVTVSTEDITSPLIVQYYKVAGDDAATLLSRDDLDAVSDWTTVNLDDGTSKVDSKTILTVDTDTQLVVYVKIADSAGNYTYVSTDGAIVDKTNAGITLTPSDPAADNGDADVYGYYNNNVTIDIAVADSAPYSGIKSIEYWITMDGVEGAAETLYSFGYDGSYAASTQWTITGSDVASENTTYTGVPTQDMLKSDWSGEITVNAADYNSSDVVVSVKVTDNAGNVNTETVALDIDTTAPAISISYDDNSPVNGTYFSSTRTATIVITERDNHFVEPTVYINEEVPAGATSYISIQAIDASGNAVTDFDPTITWTPDIDPDDPDKTTHTATIAYDADANYTFSIAYSDMATNDATIDTGDSAVPYAFTVDATAPTGSASIGENVWAVLLEKLTFGLFTNEKFDVTVSANDATSPLTIQYYKVAGDDAATLLSWADLDAVSDWTLLTDNGASNVANLSTLTVSEDEQFVVYFKLTDYADNYTYLCTDGAIVDHTDPIVDDPAPEITITPEQPVNGFYNGDVKVSIQVTDPTYGETFSGLKSVSYKVFNMGQVTQEGTLYTFTETSSTSDQLRQTWTGSITVDSELNNSNDVTIEIYAQDNALNTSSNSVDIQIDMTAPKIDIQYDNNDVDSGTYYKANRTATIVVTERNFRAEDVSVTITNTDGTIPTISDWTLKQGTGNGDDTTYTATILYNADGDYTFAIAYTDLANNVCTEISSASTNPYAFTIDKTAPTITVAYDNNTAVNDTYFSATRTATITIIEHNFDVNRVVFTQGAARGGETPNPVWANNGDVHVATISYTVDGDYTFDVTMTDLAGNASGAVNYGNSVAGQAFTLDTTYEDMITITGVANGVAYGHNADIIPSLSISDINLSGYTVTLVGVQKDQTIDLTDEVNQLLDAGAETVTGIFDIFEIRQDLDGIYTLTVTSEDSAGNTDSEEIVFTVNRYGSVYVYSQYLMDLIADGGCYVQSIGEDLVIDEYNADRLLSGSLVIEITVDGRPLENVEYTVTPEINDSVAVGESGWYQYRYTISKENFAEDGVYKISVSSQDATGNSPENTNYEGMEMTFRVDSTSPEITSIVGLEESIINAQEVTVKYTVFDTIGLKSVKVYVNGELIDEITDFSSDMNNFSSQFTLTEQSNAQTVQIVVEDMSGNITDTSAEDFTSAYAFNRTVTVSTNIFVRWYANKPLFWGSIVGSVAVVGCLGYFITAWRKKKAATKA